MARHIMAVCVVCLLCVDHLPCQQHVDALVKDTHAHLQYQQLNAKVLERTDAVKDPSSELTDNHIFSPANLAHHRRKRHANHAPAVNKAHHPKITEHFLQRILTEQGSQNSFIGDAELQRILQQLELSQLLDKSTLRSDNNNNGDKSEKGQCMNDVQLVKLLQHHDADTKLSQSKTYVIKDNCIHRGNRTKECSNIDVNVNDSGMEDAAHKRHNSSYRLDSEDMLNMCPVLLYQLISQKTTKRAICLDAEEFAQFSHDEASNYNLQDKEHSVDVWIYAFISVFACGILGLVGIAIIPFMDSRYYKHILQFLVSLAVGTMTGDALLHLLPHSLAHQTEKEMMYKGLTCMGGIIFFYITEHGLTMISEWRKSIAKQESKKPSRAKVMRDPDSSINNSVAGDKLCKNKYSSYPYCYDEIAMDTKGDVWMHLPNNSGSMEAHDAKNAERKRNAKMGLKPSEHAAAQSLLATSQNNYAPIGDFHNHHHQHQLLHEQQQQLPDSNTISTDLDGNLVGDNNATVAPSSGNDGNNGNYEEAKDTVTVILREHESSHHGHSHKHGHVHSPPESLSAVAWMIIMGDGLHNFTDGMAIGAAFAANIKGGFSTSLAVFCHELPHELGDFAILIKAGMSVKSAIYYNLLTGVLSFIGMFFGIKFGESHETAQWMFAAAAGLFIYIALVDMMPELSSAHKTLHQFVLQILGMSSGVLIMLLIAIFEGDLMNIFSASDHANHSF